MTKIKLNSKLVVIALAVIIGLTAIFVISGVIAIADADPNHCDAYVVGPTGTVSEDHFKTTGEAVESISEAFSHPLKLTVTNALPIYISLPTPASTTGRLRSIFSPIRPSR